MTDIFTIGYGNRKFEEFIRLLKQYRIEYLIDVRSQPFSRRHPDFSLKRLAYLSQNQGVRYVWMGEALGGRPKDLDCYTQDGKVDYAKYATKTVYLEGIARLKNALDQHLNVAMMCSEAKPQDCHRCKLIGETLRNEGISVFHIDETGRLKPQETVINDLLAGLVPAQPDQMSLFEDDPNQAPKLTSRKSYKRLTKRKGNSNDA